MNIKTLKETWLAEAAEAHIHGWDFSHIHHRYTEETDLPWDYERLIRKYCKDSYKLLDIDTGGGEFLLALKHPYANTSCTEDYDPNVQLCNETLLPLGIDFHRGTAENLPFPDASFDLVINRHGDLCAAELNRVLKPGGLFITEQVGENNDRELVELLLPGTPKPFSGLNLHNQSQIFQQAGFTILKAEEAYRPIRFFDVGALVWFAYILEWEFPGFTVDGCMDRLLAAQRILERDKEIVGSIHRYLLIVRKQENI